LGDGPEIVTISRRRFLRQTGVGGIGLLTFSIAGCQKKMTPAEARQSQVSYQVLSGSDVLAIETLGDALAPGSAAAGIAHYIDHQLNAPIEECMLMIRYLGVPTPFTPFYKGGLSAASAAATQVFSKPIEDLDETECRSLVSQIATGNVVGWQGPPSEFFYFVLRADAVDVRYGTKQGFADLEIPYAAHIEPPSSWGQ